MKVLAVLLLLSACVKKTELVEPVRLANPKDFTMPRCLEIPDPDYTLPGPFRTEKTIVDDTNFWKPLGPVGCAYPIIHFSNGTGTKCSRYTSVIEHLASWGFLVCCYESTATGSGRECLAGLNEALKEFPHEILPMLGSTGHSQGGGGALACAALAATGLLAIL